MRYLVRAMQPTEIEEYKQSLNLRYRKPMQCLFRVRGTNQPAAKYAAINGECTWSQKEKRPCRAERKRKATEILMNPVEQHNNLRDT